MKVISFCLYGENPYYVEGAKRNIELAKEIYKDWILFFHVEHNYSKKIIEGLKSDNTQIIFCDDYPQHLKMLWRYLPYSNPDVDVCISRDCDSRLTIREFNAVNEFIKSDKTIHSIMDHQYHIGCILMGGMIGFKKDGLYPSFINDLLLFTQDDSYQKLYDNYFWSDQLFLNECVLPKVKDKIFISCDIKIDGWVTNKMDTLYNKSEFIGNKFNEFNIPEFSRSFDID